MPETTLDLREAILGPTPTKEQILDRIEGEQIRFINLQFTDVMGIVKSVTIPAKHLRACHRRRAVDRRLLDRRLHPHRRVRHVPDAGSVDLRGDPLGDGRAHDRPRDLLGPQPEWRPLPGRPARRPATASSSDWPSSATPTRPARSWSSSSSDKDGDEISPLPHDRAGYFDYSTDLASTIRKDMVIALDEMGIDVEASHHEVAIGQHEIDFEYGDALPTADRAMTFKYVLKAIAQQHGLHATFMPKPLEGDQRLRHARPPELRLRRPARATPSSIESDPYGLSQIAKHFIAGLLPHARAHVRRDRAAGQLATAGWCRASRLRSTSPGRAPTARR